MCHFITLIVPTDDDASVRALLERYGRAAQPMDNSSIRKVLNEEECQYLTTRGHCDCGTVLDPGPDTAEEFEKKLVKEAARLSRKGWTGTKIARAIEDRRKAYARPRPSRDSADSLELWNAVLHGLREELKLPYAGLFLRFYSGNVANETFAASRRELPENIPWLDSLKSLKHDEVTIFQ